MQSDRPPLAVVDHSNVQGMTLLTCLPTHSMQTANWTHVPLGLK